MTTPPLKILIQCESQTGSVERLAHLVAQGAREIQGVEIRRRIVGGKGGSKASSDDVLEADGVTVGCPTIVANATATRDLPDIGGGIVPAEHVQAASLAAAGDIFAVIVPGLEAIERAQRDPGRSARKSGGHHGG